MKTLMIGLHKFLTRFSGKRLVCVFFKFIKVLSRLDWHVIVSSRLCALSLFAPRNRSNDIHKRHSRIIVREIILHFVLAGCVCGVVKCRLNIPHFSGQNR